MTLLTATAGSNTIKTGYTFNELNQPTTLARTFNLTTPVTQAKFVYDERGNVISVSHANGTYTAFEYDSIGRMTSIKNYNTSGTLLDSYSYTYDANGNRTVVTSATGTINYQYDELNRLIQETLLDGTTISNVYDAVGNRTQKTVGAAITNYTYDNANELTAVNGQAYTYDANGNLTSNGAKTFVYNEVNQLTQVKTSGGAVIASYTYDDTGKRISITASGSTSKYHYSGDKVIYVTDANNAVIEDYTYDAAGNPATITYGGVTYYYHLDGHGSVTSMTDSSGNVAAQYTYDAWGNILSQSGSMASINPFRYSGYRYDEATGLYYLMARYYDAVVGRFITRDTIDDVNLYVYCDNNPVMRTDANGHWWLWDNISSGLNKIANSLKSAAKAIIRTMADDWVQNTFINLLSLCGGIFAGFKAFKLIGQVKRYSSGSISLVTKGGLGAKLVGLFSGIIGGLIGKSQLKVIDDHLATLNKFLNFESWFNSIKVNGFSLGISIDALVRKGENMALKAIG